MEQKPNGNGGPDFSFLEKEYDYVTQSSFHTDKLRDRYIEFYILLTGAAFSGILGLAQSGKVTISPYVLGLISLFLAIVGAFEVLIFVRLRRVVIESLQASTLTKCTTSNTIPTWSLPFSGAPRLFPNVRGSVLRLSSWCFWSFSSIARCLLRLGTSFLRPNLG